MAKTNINMFPDNPTISTHLRDGITPEKTSEDLEHR